EEEVGERLRRGDDDGLAEAEGGPAVLPGGEGGPAEGDLAGAFVFRVGLRQRRLWQLGRLGLRGVLLGVLLLGARRPGGRRRFGRGRLRLGRRGRGSGRRLRPGRQGGRRRLPVLVHVPGQRALREGRQRRRQP